MDLAHWNGLSVLDIHLVTFISLPLHRVQSLHTTTGAWREYLTSSRRRPPTMRPTIVRGQICTPTLSGPARTNSTYLAARPNDDPAIFSQYRYSNGSVESLTKPVKQHWSFYHRSS